MGDSTVVMNIFGALSKRVDYIPQDGGFVDVASLTEMLDYQIIVIVAIVAYFLLLYIFKGYTSYLMKSVVMRSMVDKLMDEQGRLFNSYLNILQIIGVIILAIGAISICDILFGVDVLLPPPYNKFMAVVAVVVSGLIAIYRSVMLNLISRLSGIFSIADVIGRYSKLYANIGVLILSPIVLLISIATGFVANIGAVMVLIVVLGLIVYYMFKSCQLFIQQSVSILYWILYLCTVEFLPLSLPVALVVKNLT